jgi:hypothetical protein
MRTQSRNCRAASLFLSLILGWTAHGFSAGLKIGLSYGEITSYLSNVITLQRSSPVDDQPRYMGLSADKLSMLEVIGDKSNITQATLGIGVPNDSPSVLARNSALVLRFVKNATPGWSKSTDWTVAAIRKAAATEKPVETTYGSRRITMTFIKPLGMIMVTVKHK